jgi:RNA polymerase I-specific transcription initiation factor RRN7
LPQEEIEARISRVQGAMQSLSPRPDPEDKEEAVKRMGSDYRCYKHIDELEGPVKRFYEVAAEVAGLTVRDLVRAVYALEQLLHQWQRKEKRRLRDEMSDQE